MFSIPLEILSINIIQLTDKFLYLVLINTMSIADKKTLLE